MNIIDMTKYDFANMKEYNLSNRRKTTYQIDIICYKIFLKNCHFYSFC